jgi:tetratricopeptide (TPR) repeat protein
LTKPAVDAEASPVEGMLEQAYDRQRRGNLAAAEALYENVLASDPERIEALNNLGAIAIHAGRIDRGVQLVRRALQLNPQNADAQCNLGYALNLLKHHVEALGCFETTLRLDPDHASAKQNRREAMADLKQWELLEAYQIVLGVFPRLNPPVTFNERVLRRIIYDRDRRLKVLCDKLAVRKFIRQTVGDEYVVPLLGVWEHPKQINWDILPAKFALKPTHASGLVALVDRSAGFDQQNLIQDAEQWLSHDYFDTSLEWGYRGIPRFIIAEPLLQPRDRNAPLDAYVYTFFGRAALIRLLSGSKKSADRRDCWYDAGGRRLAINAAIPNVHLNLADADREHMIRIAQNVAPGFEMLRVDFYIAKSGLKIGELTPYNSGGRVQWDPPALDEILGQLWHPDFDVSCLPRQE